MTYCEGLVCVVNGEEGIVRHNDSTNGKIIAATVMISTNLESNKSVFIEEVRRRNTHIASDLILTLAYQNWAAPDSSITYFVEQAER
jgi:hypothetical protein